MFSNAYESMSESERAEVDELIAQLDRMKFDRLYKQVEPFCKVCGENHENPCNDDFPEPGDLREWE